MATKTKTPKMSNEGHDQKVPHGGAIGLVFLIGLIVGCVVVFLAVAGRTQTVIQQRKELLHDKQAKAAEAAKGGPDAATPVDPSVTGAPESTEAAPPSSGNVAP